MAAVKLPALGALLALTALALLACDDDDPEGGLEEERRLLYVGMTRAMDELCLTHARVRQHYGATTPQAPSRFLRELPEDWVEGVALGTEDGPSAGPRLVLEDEPVAVARMSQGDGVAALQGIGVVEGRRGQGFGTLMTTIATRAGMALGNRIVWLSVSESNAVARHVYARLGFRPAVARLYPIVMLALLVGSTAALAALFLPRRRRRRAGVDA